MDREIANRGAFERLAPGLVHGPATHACMCERDPQRLANEIFHVAEDSDAATSAPPSRDICGANTSRRRNSDCAYWLFVFDLTLMFRGFWDQNPLPSAIPCRAADRCIAALTACVPLGEGRHLPVGQRDRGAAMTNLSHKASFHSNERITRSNRGVKHQGMTQRL